MLQVSNPSIKYCRQSRGDKNSTTKCGVRTDVRMGKGKTICTSPLRGGGINIFIVSVGTECNDVTQKTVDTKRYKSFDVCDK